MSDGVIIALIGAGGLLPTSATIIATAMQNRASRRNAAKASIENKVMWDEFGWEIFGRYPTNYGEIHDEYQIYHRNGGNGDITRLVKQYDEWFESVDAKVVAARKRATKTK